MRTNEYFDELLLNKLNGNISDYRKQVSYLNKLALVRFISYARSWHTQGGYSNYGQFIIDIIDILESE
jgi:hypothetical protein